MRQKTSKKNFFFPEFTRVRCCAYVLLHLAWIRYVEYMCIARVSVIGNMFRRTYTREPQAWFFFFFFLNLDTHQSRIISWKSTLFFFFIQWTIVRLNARDCIDRIIVSTYVDLSIHRSSILHVLHIYSQRFDIVLKFARSYVKNSVTLISRQDCVDAFIKFRAICWLGTRDIARERAREKER